MSISLLIFNQKPMKYTIIKIILFCLILLMISSLGECQITISYDLNKIKTKEGIHYNPSFLISQFSLPPIDVETALREDSMRNWKPYLFAKAINSDIDILDAGTKIQFADTSIIFCKISSQGASSLNLTFDKFYLANNATLAIYNSDQTMLIGPISADQNPKNGTYTTAALSGDTVIIELILIGNSASENQLHISKVY